MRMKPVLAAAAAACLLVAVGCKSQAQRDIEKGPVDREGPPKGGGGGAGAQVDERQPVDLAAGPTLQLLRRT